MNKHSFSLILLSTLLCAANINAETMQEKYQRYTYEDGVVQVKDNDFIMLVNQTGHKVKASFSGGEEENIMAGQMASLQVSASSVLHHIDVMVADGAKDGDNKPIRVGSCYDLNTGLPVSFATLAYVGRTNIKPLVLNYEKNLQGESVYNCYTSSDLD